MQVSAVRNKLGIRFPSNFEYRDMMRPCILEKRVSAIATGEEVGGLELGFGRSVTIGGRTELWSANGPP